MDRLLDKMFKNRIKGKEKIEYERLIDYNKEIEVSFSFKSQAIDSMYAHVKAQQPLKYLTVKYWDCQEEICKVVLPLKDNTDAKNLANAFIKYEQLEKKIEDGKAKSTKLVILKNNKLETMCYMYDMGIKLLKQNKILYAKLNRKVNIIR